MLIKNGQNISICKSLDRSTVDYKLMEKHLPSLLTLLKGHIVK